MKINERIDSYNVKSLDRIKDAAIGMKRHCEVLESLGTMILNNINVARADGFDDINCDRAEEIIKDYKKELTKTKEEFEELKTSVDRFTGTIDDYWSSWR